MKVTINIHTDYSLVRSAEPGVVHIACGGSSVYMRLHTEFLDLQKQYYHNHMKRNDM